jgi:hypothetical protein
MRVFARGIKLPFDVPVQRSQHADARMHHEVAALGGADQAAGRGLPFRKILLSLRQLHDVSGGILESDELAAWIWNRSGPLPIAGVDKPAAVAFISFVGNRSLFSDCGLAGTISLTTSLSCVPAGRRRSLEVEGPREWHRY